VIPRVTLALRVLLGAVFIYAAYTKLRQSWLLFALSIDSYQLLPEWAVFALARTLPALELILGVLLIAGVWLRHLSIAAAAILGLFFSVMIVSYFQGAGIDCGCFGVGEPLSAKTLARDGVLLAAAIALVIYTRRPSSGGWGLGLPSRPH
jgi:putative oxidoreductase